MGSTGARLASLGLALPSLFPAVGTYVNTVRVGSTLVLGGHIPWDRPDRLIVGRLGEDLDVPAGREAARLAGLNALAIIQLELGTLDAVLKVVSVRGLGHSRRTGTSGCCRS